MNDTAKVEIINIGDELIIGQVVNTNATWMAEELSKAGFEISRIICIGDQKNNILSALEESGKQVDIIIITGGLGPTNDDITKEVLCDYFNSKLVLHKESLDNVTRIFGYYSRKVSEVNRQQAMIPDNAVPIKNDHGTAPGLWFEKDNRVFISLPGVPLEMKSMIKGYVIPGLIKLFTTGHIVHKTILTHGEGESSLSKIIEDWDNNLPPGITLAYLPQPGIVRLRLTAKGDNKQLLQAMIDEQVVKLQNYIPDLIFGYDGIRMEEVIGTLLRERKETIVTAESCTGGYIAHLITSIPGSSEYFLGSVVAYSNDVKMNELGVKYQALYDHGAVSKQVIAEMAEGARMRFGSDYALATSGIAGPDGGTPDKPVGTVWIAMATREKVIARKFLFGPHRERNIRKAALSALNMLRLEISKNI